MKIKLVTITKIIKTAKYTKVFCGDEFQPCVLFIEGNFKVGDDLMILAKKAKVKDGLVYLDVSEWALINLEVD